MVDFPLNELRFAARYPFSNTAKRIVRSINPRIDDLLEKRFSVVELAKRNLTVVLKRKPYPISSDIASAEILESHILAFPLAKIMVSFLDNPKYYDYFAKAVSDSAFTMMQNASDFESELINLANDLKLNFEINNGVFKLSVVEFLSVPFKSDVLKLANQDVASGYVFLNKHRFASFLAEKAAHSVLISLPVDVAGLPKQFKDLAFEALNESMTQVRRSISGKANLSYLPPCIETIYADLLAGKNVPHMARFVLATFLNAINVPEEKIVEAFSRAPNYNEKVTRYQVSRIVHGSAGKVYKPASCSKMRSYGLCVAECRVKHPLQYYRKQLAKRKLLRTKKSGEKNE